MTAYRPYFLGFVVPSLEHGALSIASVALYHVLSTVVIVGNQMHEVTAVSFSSSRHRLIFHGPLRSTGLNFGGVICDDLHFRITAVK